MLPADDMAPNRVRLMGNDVDMPQSSSVLPWQAVDPIEETLLHRKVGVMGMVFIAFFWVSGGLYGNEELIGAAPPLYVLIMIVAMPLVFSLPIALITAELASAFPVDGGQCVYVQRACGDKLGGHNCYFVFITNVVDATVYPLIAVQYLGYHLEITYLGGRLIAMTMIAAVTVINVGGLEVLTRFQGIIFVVTLLPCLIFIAFGLPELDVRAVLETEGSPVNWSLLFAWVIWLYSGFSSLGTIAGETADPHRTYVQTIAILMPLVITLNAVPFLVALSHDPDTSHYQAGYFAQLALEMAGSWLRLAIVVGSNVALVGLFNSQAITAQCTAFFFVESRPTYKQIRLDALARSRLPSASSLGRNALPWLLEVPASGVPRIYVLFTAAVSCCLVWLPYGMLVEFEVLLYCVSTLLFLFSFVYLRAVHPDAKRAFQVGRGVRGAVLLVVVPVLICVVNIYVGLFVEPYGTCDDGGARRLDAAAADDVIQEPPPLAWDPGPNFKQQGFVTVLLIGAFVHACAEIYAAPEAQEEAVPPDEPLEMPAVPTRRNSTVDVLGDWAPAGDGWTPQHTRRIARRSGRTSGAASRTLSRLWDPDQIMDSFLAHMAVPTGMTVHVEEYTGRVINREELLSAFQSFIALGDESVVRGYGLLPCSNPLVPGSLGMDDDDSLPEDGVPSSSMLSPRGGDNEGGLDTVFEGHVSLGDSGSQSPHGPRYSEGDATEGHGQGTAAAPAHAS